MNKECIYIANTRNNLKRRTNLRVYRIEEPKVDAVNPFGKSGNELQGESVDYDPYTGTIYHTSELYQGVTPVLYAIRCQ